MKTQHPFLRVIGFIFVFCIFFSIASQVLSKKYNYDSQTTTFYKQPKDSIDVLFLGASGFYRGVSPLIMWEEQGFTSYTRAIPAQQAFTTYYYFLESLEYQNPKVVVLDAYRLVNSAHFEIQEFAYRASYEPMRFSRVKLQSLLDITSESDPSVLLGYIFPLYRYHNRWKELEKEDWRIFRNNADEPFKGQAVTFRIYPTSLPDNFMAPTDEIGGIKEISREYYEKIIQLCLEKDIEVILVSMPRLERSDYFEYAAVSKFSEEYGLTLIDYNLPELMDVVGFDPLTDMADKNHVNAFGAEKFSRHLGDYISTQFNLADKREDPNFNQWHIDAKELNQLIKENR